MQTRPTREEAAEAFVRELTNHVYRGMTQDIISILSAPSPYEISHLNGWFQSLDAEGKKSVEDLVRYTIELSIFSSLNVLDGTSGAVLVPGKDGEEPQFGECLLSLELYPDSSTISGDAEPTSIQISDSVGCGDLHDIFSYIMNDEPNN